MKKFGFFLILTLIFAGDGSAQTVSFEKPRVGIVISKTNVEHRWGRDSNGGTWLGRGQLLSLSPDGGLLMNTAKQHWRESGEIVGQFMPMHL
ncbi:MAG: hypothetical protein K9N46_08880 [Candidatus Marinimicrobia bacterium]|nr:hypothetical protein [Candidatus Neomarinimicrobiota bacterium]MCF7830221.1 hypothetical protein [Candidatus Neomarinimicrobiota bacterium]MCF7880838.1 hypothetical protein [Candidatus Neomarinimicrobiota bacterium]